MNNQYSNSIPRPQNQFNNVPNLGINQNITLTSVGQNNFGILQPIPTIASSKDASDTQNISPLLPMINNNINNILQNHNILQLQQQQIQNLTNSMPLLSNMAFTTNQLISKEKMQELVKEVDPSEQLDEDVEEMLMQMADDFLESIITNSCLLAKHRKSSTLEVKDVQLYLEKYWNIIIPGYASSPEDLKQGGNKRIKPSMEAHKQRMAIIKRALKKG